MAQSGALSSKNQRQAGQAGDKLGWKQELKDLMRGVAGGAVFGAPLLYTMEMWQHALVFSPWRILTALAAILIVNFFFNRLSGFRRSSSFGEALSETITSVAIGLTLSALVLWLIGEINSDLSLDNILSKIVLESMAVSLGVSFANSQFDGRSRTGDDQNQPQTPDGSPDKQEEPPKSVAERKTLQWQADLKDFGATVAGSTLFCFNIAPTEEIVLIGARLLPWQLLVLFVAELAFCYIILFASEINQREQFFQESLLQHPLAETLMATALSLLIAFLLLLLVGRPEAGSGASILIPSAIALGLPAVIGGAAGRLVT